MKHSIDELNKLYRRDLNRLIAEIDAIPDQHLWSVMEGAANSCGVLCQHIVGNLRHFITAGVGSGSYVRDREREFRNTGRGPGELTEEVEECMSEVAGILNGLDENMVSKRCSEVLEMKVPLDTTVFGFLMHLYGHLNYHLGQINYQRRYFSSKK